MIHPLVIWVTTTWDEADPVRVRHGYFHRLKLCDARVSLGSPQSWQRPAFWALQAQKKCAACVAVLASVLGEALAEASCVLSFFKGVATETPATHLESLRLSKAQRVNPEKDGAAYSRWETLYDAVKGAPRVFRETLHYRVRYPRQTPYARKRGLGTEAARELVWWGTSEGTSAGSLGVYRYHVRSLLYPKKRKHYLSPED